MTKTAVSMTLMRPIKTYDEGTVALQLLLDYMYDEDDRLDEIVPEGRNFVPVAIASDESAVEFDVFVDDRWPEPNRELVGRILLRRKDIPAIAS